MSEEQGSDDVRRRIYSGQWTLKERDNLAPGGWLGRAKGCSSFFNQHEFHESGVIPNEVGVAQLQNAYHGRKGRGFLRFSGLGILKDLDSSSSRAQ